jgi:hypothetical protein
MKIRPVRAEIFHAGGQTNGDEIIVAFRNFVKAPNKTKSRLVQSVQRLGYGLDNQRTVVGFQAGGKDFSLPKVSRPALGSIQPPTDYRGRGRFPIGQTGRNFKLTTHRHLVQRLIMSAAIPPLPYTLTACTGETSL